MKIEQKITTDTGWQTVYSHEGFNQELCQIVLVLGGKNNITFEALGKIKVDYPNAQLISATTAGEIANYAFYDEQLSTTAIYLEKTPFVSKLANIKDFANSYDLGLDLFKNMPKNDLKYIFVLSDGGLINGTELLEGINSENNDEILITGGLAGDGSRFQSTLVGVDANLESGNVVLIGFYGEHIKVGHGSLGGWDEFGPERIVTKSEKNVLFELDNKNALELYKQYLGSYADELPGSALLFPISISNDAQDTKNVRTILSIDESNQSMTFAGNLPEGSKVRLMKANFDKIINASGSAAQQAVSFDFDKPDLAILISCVGRKLILNDRVEEEIEIAKDIFGAETCVSGFYSYGEISPLVKSQKCELQNQTMTITTLKEI
ncbi:FIST signal transduction protein [Lacihabitans sp. CS3-21]|uniref:FIST signal transduction protein n=1 Tax=Lacihabitans sp. CS3-21 TaxID=2487332 RepID=UPI0020CFCC8C|nr:FIST N-terminal domain-containing protein [Lacihabitans sp. CS3-21]MCP9746174.1 histidine kinase [Lacihabitans sp. CS3-21]